ncbi:MAG TPA: hypothetical protein VEL31_31980 [Ktedonobacteraceae bacterium]|nr:hypothetical protein [Ktedonobacteraceae bacterium]
MQQQESENNPEPAKPALSAQKVTGPHEQKQQQNRLTFVQRFQLAIQLQKVLSRAAKQDSVALQIEDTLAKNFEQLNIPEQFIQRFKDGLEKQRQAKSLGYHEDTYIMGGILIYCGILLPVLISLGIPDFPVRFAWIALAISFPCAVGFLLIRFLKKRSSISNHGWIHGILSLLGELGILATTASLFFHVWNVVGWVFLLWALVIVFGYYIYRWNIYYGPSLGILKDILKKLNDLPPSPV